MIEYNRPTPRCPLCMAQSSPSDLAEAAWASPEVITRLVQQNPSWRRESGACPACVQQALLYVLLEKGDAALHDGIQSLWPLDAEAAFGAMPTPVRMHAPLVGHNIAHAP